jgi:dihydroflavonol-4-reductase
VGGTENLLESARQSGVERVIHTSTVSTIGLLQGGVGTEDTPIDPHHLVGHYKQSKYQAEQAALRKCAEGLPVVVVNPTAPIGPWDVKPTPTGRMVLDFLLGRMPAYVATGMNLVHVADVADGHILALEKGRPGQRYLLGHRNLSLLELFTMLQQLTGCRAPRWRVPFWLAIAAGYADLVVEGGLLRREPRIPLEGVKVAKTPMYVSCQKAVSELGLPQTLVETALEDAIGWFREYGYT